MDDFAFHIITLLFIGGLAGGLVALGWERNRDQRAVDVMWRDMDERIEARLTIGAADTLERRMWIVEQQIDKAKVTVQSDLERADRKMDRIHDSLRLKIETLRAQTNTHTPSRTIAVEDVVTLVDRFASAFNPPAGEPVPGPDFYAQLGDGDAGVDPSELANIDPAAAALARRMAPTEGTWVIPDNASHPLQFHPDVDLPVHLPDTPDAWDEYNAMTPEEQAVAMAEVDPAGTWVGGLAVGEAGAMAMGGAMDMGGTGGAEGGDGGPISAEEIMQFMRGEG